METKFIDWDMEALDLAKRLNISINVQVDAAFLKDDLNKQRLLDLFKELKALQADEREVKVD